VIATLWARKKIHDLTRDMYDSYGYMSGDQEIIDEITDTALDYQIMSDYTSFVAVSEEVRTDPDSGDPVTVQVPVNMPEGVSYEGVFGSEDIAAGYTGSRGLVMNRTSVSPAPTSTMQSFGGAGGYDAAECEELVDADYSGEYYSAAPSASVSHVSASPTLGLMPSEVRRAARELVDALREVYGDYVEDIEEPAEWPMGTVTFLVSVNGSGTVTSVSVEGTGLSPDLDSDLEEVLEDLEIPAPPDGAGVIRLQYSFSQAW